MNPWSCDGYKGFEEIVNSISDKYWIPENKAIGSANHYNMIMHIHDKYPIFNYKEAE